MANSTNSGKLIVFEGLDGSGHSQVLARFPEIRVVDGEGAINEVKTAVQKIVRERFHFRP